MNAVVEPKRWLSLFVGHQKTKITGTQHHHKLILYSSCHIQRVLVVSEKVEQGTIRVGNKPLLLITGDFIARIVNQRAMSCHHQ